MNLYKASGDDVPSLLIEASTTVPRTADLESQRDLFDEQAKLVVDAMIRSLPGGTVDAILCRLLEHKRSLFIVTHSQTKED